MVKPGQKVTNATSEIGVRHGMPVYRTNPSVPSAGEIPRGPKRFQVPGGNGAVIVDNSSGEIKGIGGMGFWWDEEVDKEKFVKLFLDGIRSAAGLSKTGIQAFEVVYHQMQLNPNNDKIELNAYIAEEHGLAVRTFRRGIRELLEKQFLFRSPSEGLYFVNIRFMFNGNRLAFVKSYHLKNTNQQVDLPLEDPPPVLPPPATE
jgi:hypothetical protein